MGEVTKASILAARTKMAKRKGRGASGLMAPKTINSHMTILRMIMTEAAERICKYVREDYRIYYQLRFYTGMRTGEIDGLKWEHVDFEGQEILVRETLINGETEYTKTDGSQREIPMFGPV